MCPVSKWSIAIFVTFFSMCWLPVADANAKKFTVNKCCPKGQVFLKYLNCSSLNQTGNVKLHEFQVPKYVNKSGAFDFYRADEYDLSYEFKIDNNSQILNPKSLESQLFYVLETGYLKTNSQLLTPENYSYCFDEKFKNGSLFYMAVVGPELAPCDVGQEEKRCKCSPGHYNKYCPKPSVHLTLYCMAISLLFLILTFFVYAVNNELQNVHGKSLLCHIASLFFAYSIHILNEWRTFEIIDLGISCLGFAYARQFFFVATFFWLNVMCFEIWWNFRSLKITPKEYEKKKFIIYSTYAWGCSMMISLITFAIVNFTSIDPQFGIEYCFFHSQDAELWLFYVPISILLLSNLLMFTHIIYVIINQQQYSSVFNISVRRRESEENENLTFKFYCTLFFMMGLNWLLDVIVWVITDKKKPSTNLQDIINIGNSFQGLFIFIICVCNKPVLRLLNRKLCPQYQFIKASSVASTRNSIDNTVM